VESVNHIFSGKEKNAKWEFGGLEFRSGQWRTLKQKPIILSSFQAIGQSGNWTKTLQKS